MPPGNERLIPVLAAVTLAVASATLLSVVALLSVRFARRAQEREREELRKRCEPLLFEAMSGGVVAPAISERQRRPFLELWLSVQAQIRAEESENLNHLARQLGLDKEAARLLRRRDLADRLLGLRAVGLLRVRHAWRDTERLLASRVPAEALRAAETMVLIDSHRAIPAVLVVLRAGREWTPSQVVRILDRGGVHARGALAELLERSRPREARHLIRLLALVHNTVMLPVLRERALRSRNPEELAEVLSALGRLGGSAERELVLSHLGSEHWLVRMKAAQALGAIGESGDEPRLLQLLADPKWWVRFRAAEALARLPGMTSGRLGALSDGVDDRYGRGVLAQVIAEMEPAA